MKKILMLGTGGTIASEITENGLSPQLTTEQILHYCPDISGFCRVDCRQLCNLDSTNIAPEHWQQMANAIRENYDRYDGFVLTHGTDTMAYTAAALSYLIQYSKKPIVLTGSQKPINLEITDSKTNLVDAFHYAASEDAHGVSIVFNGRVILGTRARKTHSKSFQAFSSINYPELAVIQDGRLLSYITQEYRKQPVFGSRLDPAVGLIKLVPGLEADFLAFMLERKDGVVIESFGVGGIPSAGRHSYYEVIDDAMAKGKTVVMTTQVPNEGSDLLLYHVGNRLKTNLDVLEAYDMTTEAAVTKLMWILGQTRERREIERLFYRPVSHDILMTAGEK